MRIHVILAGFYLFGQTHWSDEHGDRGLDDRDTSHRQVSRSDRAGRQTAVEGFDPVPKTSSKLREMDPACLPMIRR
jgi:hypothetical protein